MSQSEKLVTLSNTILKECADNAVFTLSQTKEILRLDTIFTKFVINLIENLPREEVMCEIMKLIEYDEHNTEIVSQMKRDIEHLDKELTCTEHQLHELSEKTGLALVSQAHELEQLECTVKALAVKDYKDDRIDKILDILSTYSTHKDIEKLECAMSKIISSLSVFAKQECLEKLIKRLTILEAKEIHDLRVDALLCKIEKMEKVNTAQSVKINELSEEVACLNRKLDRNTLALDNKIDTLERRETVDAKVDSDQNATLRFLQGEIVKLNSQIDRMEKAFLMKPCV